jgi:mono/diheme cytochrome c family protein
MLRYFFASLFLVVVAVITLAGGQGERFTKPPLQIFPDMKVQPRFEAQHGSDFYADTRAARKVVPGTVPQGYTLEGDFSINSATNARGIGGPKGFSNGVDYVNTGKIGGFWGEGMPSELEMTEALFARGKERYAISCAVCHGATGAGNGIVSQFGLNGIASLQDARIRNMPEGQIFETITHGKGNMGGYGSSISVGDRWAIIAYLRALERSQIATLADVPEEHRTDLEKQ